MEQTLGKRIVFHRKQLGLTQDQLAEKLGVTAQAVSKWENDQSCPDITMLPILAELFGTSIDELLGRQRQMIHESEVIDRKEQENDGIHIQKDGFEFKYDSGRRGAIGFAVWVLLVGGLLLTSNLLSWDVSFWDILWPSALMVLGLFGLYPKFSFFCLGCTLFGGFFLLSNLHVFYWDAGEKKLLLPVLLVLFGLSLLVDAFRKPKKPIFEVTYNNDGSNDDHPKNFYVVTDEAFDLSASFGDMNQYIAVPRLSRGQIKVSFGDYDIDLSGVESVAESCVLVAECSFGDLTILVPRRYQVQCESDATFADVEMRGHADPNPAGVILMRVNANFGDIIVEYI